MSWQKQKKELEEEYNLSDTGIAMDHVDTMLGDLYSEYEDKTIEEILDLVEEILKWERKNIKPKNK